MQQHIANQSVKFHWASPLDSGQQSATGDYSTGSFDLEGLIDFVQSAERAGIESLLMGISYHMPDPLPLIGALSRETSKIQFILAYRPGLISPTLFTQVVNTISWINDKRVALNIVAGISPAEQAYYGDYCNHTERYRRTSEFLEISNKLWNGEQPLTYKGEFYNIVDAELGLGYKDGGRPFTYLAGGSSNAQIAAIAHADCLLRYGDVPEKIAADAEYMHQQGLKIGVRMHVIARNTRTEALQVIDNMMSTADEAHRASIAEFMVHVDSHAVKNSFELAENAKNDWLSPMLWSGAVPYRGGPALAIVGSYEEVARYFMEYKQAGVDEFILSGWPTRDEMETFCDNVVPRFRVLEAAALPELKV